MSPPSDANPLPLWRLRLLGAVELHSASGRSAKLPSRAASLLLARLALAPHSQHAREELTDLIWPDADTDSGRNRLRNALSVLRALLEPEGVATGSVLQADRRAIWLQSGALVCDAHQLLLALKQGQPHIARPLMQGDLLPGYFDEWVLQERSHIQSRCEALAAQAPAAQGAQSRTSRLPQYLTRLIGFDAERSALAQQVHEHRLVLLRAPGGAGKTRLAVEVAHQLDAAGSSTAAHFAGVFFVALAACQTRDHMVDAVLQTLQADGGPAQGSASQRVVAALAGRRVLLVLDNFEQLVDSCQAELAQWLAALPSLHLLVTSRRMLGLDGECEHALAALGPPTSQSATTNSRVTLINPAVTLFVDRAQAVQPNFQVTPHNRQQLADVVQALHGLPLAIELAAARMRSLGLADLHTMLVQNPVPGASLALLARAGPRGLADPRHASMQLVLQWSWQQLDSDEQSLLAALASCDAGASLALLALLSDKPPSAVAARVDTLVAASVAYQRADAQGSSRFYVFEPMREFVFVHVGAAGLAQLRSAHARAMAQWAATLGREPLLAQVRAEIPNLMRALASASDPAVPAATPQQAINTLLAARHVLDDINLSASSLVHARQVAQLAPRHQAPALHALLAGHSFFAGEAEHARAHAQAALVALVAPGSEASAAITAAVQRDVARVLLRLGHPHDEVMALLHQALAGAEREGLAEVKALAKASIAVMHFRADHDVQANVQRHREVVALWRSHGPQVRITESLVGLAIALGFAHQLQEQLLVLQEARARATALGQRRLLAFCSSVTGYALADLKRYDEARAMYRQCLRMAWDDAAWREWFYALWNLPRTLAHQRQPEAAAQLMGFAQAFFAGRFGVLGREDLPEERRTRRLLHAQWGVQRTAAAWQAGAAISMREAMAMAMRWTEDAPMDGLTA